MRDIIFTLLTCDSAKPAMAPITLVRTRIAISKVLSELVSMSGIPAGAFANALNNSLYSLITPAQYSVVISGG